MEPRIQYAKTSDGVDIAYCVEGKGQSLVLSPSVPFCNVQLLWEVFGYVLQALSRSFRLVWYDCRGCGLSGRYAVDFSTEAMLRDFDAVAASLGIARSVLLSVADGVPFGIAIAASRPEIVSHLVVVDGWANPSDLIQSPAAEVETALRDKDWVLYTETLARVLNRFGDDEFARRLAAFIRECVGPGTYRAAMAAQREYDVSSFLSEITASTMVVHNRDNPWVGLQVGQRLAARIPNSCLGVIDDPTWVGLPSMIEEFLGIASHAAPAPPSPQLPFAAAPPEAGMTAILFADIADSTVLTERLGDAPFRERARELDGALRAVIRDNGGTPVEGKLLGDGVLAVFTSARQAIEAALACGRAGTEAGLPLHLGLHAGDVIREEGNVYGGAVNVAARISALSAPGEVLVSETVRSLARTSAGVRFDDRGVQSLKGVSEPMRVWAVREGE